MIVTAIWTRSGKIVKFVNKKTVFFTTIFSRFWRDAAKLAFIDLIDHHSHDVKFHSLLNGGTAKGLRPSLTELFGFS